MNTYLSHNSLKHNLSVKSAVIIMFPLDRARRRETPTLPERTVSASRELRRGVVLLRRGQAAESVNRLLHLRILQAAVFALKLSGAMLRESEPDERAGPLPS